jgi:hypothetical protein
LCSRPSERWLLSWKTLAEADLLFTGLLLFWLLMLWKAGYGMVRMRLLINRLKGGAVMAHGPSRQRNHPVSRVITGVLSALLLICFVGVGAERLLDNTVPLPETAAGLPYLLGTEVFDARRAGPDEASSYRKKINVVQTSPTLFAPVQYHTNEDFVLSGGASGTLYQHIYEVRTPELAQKLAWSLAEDSVFSPLDGYIRVNIAGLDLAMRSNGGMEVIAVKDNTAVYAILIGPDGPEGQMRLLEAYGQKLQLESQGD